MVLQRRVRFVKIKKVQHLLWSKTKIFTCCCCLFFLFILSACLVFIFLYFQTCNTDTNCRTSNPCSIDLCHNHFCHYEKKKNCCVTDADCGFQQCYQSYCDQFTNKCTVFPLKNGTLCTDTDSCTVNDACYEGECIGKSLLCDHGNECMAGMCMESQGCVYENKNDGEPCNDNNFCTTHDKCYNGFCIAETKDCTNLDSSCSVGACDIATGDCIRLARNQGVACDDGKQCTVLDKCQDGFCVGESKSCLDNNPCTVHSCSEDVGCFLQYKIESGTCIPGCLTDEGCPLSFICYDGTCIKTPDVEQQHISMINYEIEECTNSTYSRLIQHFTLDTLEVSVNGETRYRIIKHPSDIVIDSMYAPLGFGKDVFNLAYNHFDSGIARTTFSIATECQVFTKENCRFVFANRQYRFFAYAHDCLNINGMASGCIAMNHLIKTSVSLSLSVCTNFMGDVEIIYPYGTAVVMYYNKVYRERINFITETDNVTFGVVGIETNTVDSVLPIIDNMRICQGNPLHHLGGCVDGTNTSECYNVGCYGWDPNDSPLSFRVDIISNMSVTALALTNSFLARGCYGNENYNLEDKCQLTKCNEYGLDDYFTFLFKEFKNEQNYVFDITYKLYFCNRRRRLLTQDNTKHSLTVVKFN